MVGNLSTNPAKTMGMMFYVSNVLFFKVGKTMNRLISCRQSYSGKPTRTNVVTTPLDHHYKQSFKEPNQEDNFLYTAYRNEAVTAAMRLKAMKEKHYISHLWQ